jgi:hypothetical protein
MITTTSTGKQTKSNSMIWRYPLLPLLIQAKLSEEVFPCIKGVYNAAMPSKEFIKL